MPALRRGARGRVAVRPTEGPARRSRGHHRALGGSAHDRRNRSSLRPPRDRPRASRWPDGPGAALGQRAATARCCSRTRNPGRPIPWRSGKPSGDRGPSAGHLEAAEAGTLRRIIARVGEDVPVSGTIALIAPADVSDDDLDAVVQEARAVIDAGVPDEAASGPAVETADI